MKKPSNKDKVKKILLDEGVIDNKFCLMNGTSWRLSDIILKLRREGMDIETIYNTPEVGKNTHYILKNRHPIIVYDEVMVDGELMRRKREIPRETVNPKTQTLI
jgi:hypothetical protein